MYISIIFQVEGNSKLQTISSGVHHADDDDYDGIVYIEGFSITGNMFLYLSLIYSKN